MSQAVIIAESEQRAKLKEDCTGFASALHFILHDCRVLPLNHENGLLDLNTLNFKREDGEWLEAELLEILEPFGMHDSLILIRAQVKRPAIDEDSFFQLGKKHQASNRRLRGSNEKTVIAAGIDSGQGGRCEAPESVGLKPFAAASRLEVAAQVLSKTNHDTGSS
jgi:hypothetical protein